MPRYNQYVIIKDRNKDSLTTQTRWPPGPRRSDLTCPAAGPAQQFRAFWADHGEAVQAYVRNSTHELRRTLEELRALQTLYESGYHTQRGMHVVIYEVRLTSYIMNGLRRFQPTDGNNNSMTDVLAASLDMDASLDIDYGHGSLDMDSLPAPLGRQLALLQGAQAAHALLAAVLCVFETVYSDDPADDPARDPLRIWPFVQASIAQLEQFLLHYDT
jgi:hypothetical protein